MSRFHGSSRRADLPYFPPEVLVLITDPEHKLYDPRVIMPIDPLFVSDVKENGIEQPVILRRHNETLFEVVAGRQRVRWAIEANKQLRKEGAPAEDLIQVPGVVKKLTDDEAYDLMVRENQYRTNDSLLEQAKKARKRMDNGGYSLKRVAALLGYPLPYTKQLLAILDCSDAVQEAIMTKKLPLAATLEMSTFSREDQDKKLAEMTASGALERGDGIVAVAEAAKAVRQKAAQDEAKAKPKAKRGLREVAKVRDLLESVDPRAQGKKDLRSFLLGFIEWTRGGASDDLEAGLALLGLELPEELRKEAEPEEESDEGEDDAPESGQKARGGRRATGRRVAQEA